MLLSDQETNRLQKENKNLRDKIKHQQEIIQHERSLWNARNGSELGVA